MRRGIASLTVLLTLLLAPAAFGDGSSLYTGPGPRPGPGLLYQPPASAPQLSNSGPWQASPLLVSGASAYRGGEFLYQDFLYDDHGAHALQRDPNDKRSGGSDGTNGDLFSQPNGTYTYPTNPAYAGNAADFVELRVKPLAGATAFRITLNTMKDPSLVGTTIALGGTAGVALDYPHDARASGPADLFLTVHGDTAELVNAATKLPAGTATVTTDTTRRQIEITVPHSAWDPTGKTERLAAGVGLWDKAANNYLTPQQSADADHPGGAFGLANPTAFFNVAFRFQIGRGANDPGAEPLPSVGDNSALSDPRWWRDQAQGKALASADMSPFFADVDFRKLAAGTNDEMPDAPTGVPQSGAIDRILASHFETAQGTDFADGCSSSATCKGEYLGRLQPYAIYIPKKPPPVSGYGLTLLLHSLNSNYNQFVASRNQSQFGERGTGSIVITPEGRGPDGWYYEYAGADTFEVWADVASRYKLDPAFTAIAGYSMGGYGTYKFATQFPDLFARGQPTVGPPGLGVWAPPADPQPGGSQSNTFRQLASLRNVPFLIWVETSDELVPFSGTEQQARGFDDLGYRYAFDAFQQGDHLTLAINDQYQPAADFLGDAEVDRNPAHVTFVRNPTMDFPGLGTTADHAYWLSGVDLRAGGGDAPLGTVDVKSAGFGVGDPVPSATQAGGGALTRGTVPAISYTEQSKSWGAGPRQAIADRLDIDAKNVRSVTIDPVRAKVDCDARLVVNSDGPVTVTLAGCGRRATFAGGAAGACDATRPPRASISRPGSRVARRKLLIRGRAIAFRCARGRPVRGKVKRVSVSLSRRVGLRCRFLTKRGTLSSVRSCSKPVRLRARFKRLRGGKVAWTLERGKRDLHLSHGRYTAAVRAVDTRGRPGGRRGRFNHKGFRIR